MAAARATACHEWRVRRIWRFETRHVKVRWQHWKSLFCLPVGRMPFTIDQSPPLGGEFDAYTLLEDRSGDTMTLAELLTLAAATLNSVPHHPAVTPELCASICWIESRGTASARGDGGKARGLAQFHDATWKRFRPQFPSACAVHRRETGHFKHADCPRCAMSALVAELCYAAGRAPKEQTDDAGFVRRFLCRFHNAGRFDDENTAYVRNVEALMRELSKRRTTTTQPATSEASHLEPQRRSKRGKAPLKQTVTRSKPAEAIGRRD